MVRVRVRVRPLVWHTGGRGERLGRPVATAVCAEDGREETELVPANDELLHVRVVVSLGEAAAVAAHIGRPPWDA